jgi:hypothetical protein
MLGPEGVDMIPDPDRRRVESEIAARVAEETDEKKKSFGCSYMRACGICPLVTEDIENVGAYKTLAKKGLQNARRLKHMCHGQPKDAKVVGKACAELCGTRGIVFDPKSLLKQLNSKAI